MVFQPVELGPEDKPKRCDHCSAAARCGGETIDSIGPRYFLCLACLCAAMVELP